MGAGNWVDVDELDGTYPQDENAAEAVSMASHILWAFSGRKFARVRTVTETYECACRRSGPLLPWHWNVLPVLDGGEVSNQRLDGGCGCSGAGTGRRTRLRLRGTPVRSVQSVTRGSVTLEPGTYRVENSGLLTLDPGSPGDECGLTVDYTYGTGIPAGGRVAAKLLSQELLNAWSGADECRLPDRVTNVSRQGISFTVLDKQEFLGDLRTGILEVDLFLKAVNPDMARKKARVFSPDLPKAYRTTTTPAP